MLFLFPHFLFHQSIKKSYDIIHTKHYIILEGEQGRPAKDLITVEATTALRENHTAFNFHAPLFSNRDHLG